MLKAVLGLMMLEDVAALLCEVSGRPRMFLALLALSFIQGVTLFVLEIRKGRA